MTEVRAPYGSLPAVDPSWIGDDTLDALRTELPEGGPIGRALAELSARRDGDIWWPLAVSVLLQVVEAPEVAACLRPVQRRAVERVRAGYGGFDQ